MTPLDWIIVTAAVALVALTNWYFLGPKGVAVVAAGAAGAPVEITVRVEGGYSPSAIEVPAGSLLRLTFDRREDNPCSEEVVIPDAGIRRTLPVNGTATVEFTVPPGRHDFMCGMGMLHGTITGK